MCDQIENCGTLPNGFHITRRRNEAGGYTYYSDEVGGGVVVWDTALTSEDTLLGIIAMEHSRRDGIEAYVSDTIKAIKDILRPTDEVQGSVSNPIKDGQISSQPTLEEETDAVIRDLIGPPTLLLGDDASSRQIIKRLARLRKAEKQVGKIIKKVRRDLGWFNER